MKRKHASLAQCLTLACSLVFANVALANGAQLDAIQTRFGATNVTDILANIHGGLRTGARVLDKLDLTASFVGGSDLLLGGSGFVDLQWTDATDFSGRLVGDLQTVSNIDAPSDVRLFNAWLRWDLGDVGGVKAGVIDLNSEFDVQDTGALFLNSSHGIGPDFSQSGQNGPSIFPATGLGVVGWWFPDQKWTVKLGVFEGVPGDPRHPGRESISITDSEGALLAIEARDRITPDIFASVGAWVYTASFLALDDNTAHGNSGGYFLLEGNLYGEGGAGGSLDGWLRSGVANSNINQIDTYVGGGLVYTGLFADDDQLGVAVAYAHFGAPARLAAITAHGRSGDGEATLEATYRFTVGDLLSVQPDVQYVLSPSADPSLKNAMVLGSRITLTWN